MMQTGITIRPYHTDDFPVIQKLSDAEGWPTPGSRPTDAHRAWRHSYPALVAVHHDQVIGFLRAITDGAVTTYIAELLVVKAWRGQRVSSFPRISKEFLNAFHSLHCPKS